MRQFQCQYLNRYPNSCWSFLKNNSHNQLHYYSGILNYKLQVSDIFNSLLNPHLFTIAIKYCYTLQVLTDILTNIDL